MYTPLGTDKQQNQKNLIFSVVGLSSITVNNTVYLYGGETNEQIYNDKIWYISAKDVPLNISPTLLKSRQNDRLGLDNLSLSPGVVINNSIITICSNTTANNIQSNANSTVATNITLYSTQPMSICSFDLNKNTQNNRRTVIPSPSSSLPSIKSDMAVSIAPDQRQIYIFGGQKYVSSQKFNQTEAFIMASQLKQNEDFWKYDVESLLWTQLPSPFTNNLSRCGHTATMLRDGRIVIIGGYSCLSVPVTKDVSQRSVDLVAMNQILLFDTKATVWLNTPKVQGVVPLARTYHSAILMNHNNDIFICGGQNEILSPNQIYLGSQNGHLEDMSAILDTSSWTWRIPKQSPIHQPYPQSFASLSLVNDTKLVYGYGLSYHTLHDHFRVFDTVTEAWEPTASSKEMPNIENKSTDFNIALVWIVLGSTGFIIAFLYGVAIWKVGFRRFHMKMKNGIALIKREAWKPRVGEPGWAETLRLALKLLFAFLFVYLIFTLTSQVINSPVIDQLSFESSPEQILDVPDIKFCFENDAEENNKEPFIQCATDFGVQCSQYITHISDQMGTSHTDPANKKCLLFSTPLSFKLGQTSERLHSNGSFLKFDYYYKVNGTTPLLNDISVGSNQQVQVTIYNKLINLATLDNRHSNHDINILNDDDDLSMFAWTNMQEEDGHYKYANSRDSMMKNSYVLNFGFTSTINFELIKRVTLNTGVWNYAGIAPSVSTRHEIETAETPEYFSTVYDPSSGAPQPLGSLHVVPLTSQTKVLREQKAFAFINAMGIFGGLFGLLFSLQSCLFGYRPRSPWGYMHRWSFGHFRSSLMRGLQVNFFPNNTVIGTPTPFQKQEKLNKYRMTPIDSKVNTLSRMDQIMEANHVHPLSARPKLTIQTKNLQNNNASYLLPTSPTLSIPIGYHEDEKEIRMALIEDRIHMLERLFQAYYIDDEIFRSLDHALRNDSSSSSSTASVDSARAGRKL